MNYLYFLLNTLSSLEQAADFSSSATDSEPHRKESTMRCSDSLVSDSNTAGQVRSRLGRGYQGRNEGNDRGVAHSARVLGGVDGGVAAAAAAAAGRRPRIQE